MKKKIKSKVLKTVTTPKTVPLAKSLGELMKDEDGFVSKETILKVGLSTVAALGVTGAFTDITSGCGHTNYNTSVHTNAIAAITPNTNCATHTNITTHTSY